MQGKGDYTRFLDNRTGDRHSHRPAVMSPHTLEDPMKVFRIAVALAAPLLISACAKNDSATTDSATLAGSTAGPAPISLADVAGKWQVSSKPLSGADTATNKYILTATADTTGWQIEFPSGLKVPLRVAVSGDSVQVRSGTFSSQRRRNLKVMTEGWSRLQGGKLVGTTTAHYQGAKDSVLQLRTEGTRIP
jgi:hypothetical protein